MILHDTVSKRCFTVAGWLVRDGKVLLIKHRMLGIWLAPGGHVEPNEVPNFAIEREFFEETNLRVRAISALPVLESETSEFLPVPFYADLHWINKPGEHKARSNGEICEQHYVFAYFVRAIDENLDIQHETTEATAIGWFSEQDLLTLSTRESIKNEARCAIRTYPKT
ncbi:MAG: NUDIX hydrolase [Microgenomates group bacterium GW2011_GWF2_45_18]|nr:MAG: NUDIX hydrolase [Microgenomates group bacterium GW2011_GWF1_44_10]KKU02137.1 MAG: NUDIX hydrolase [Microgenomates group bacterium GW2011_GWF2_45_18]OGJ41779.1 MAG: hypothetical protein A2378_00670 [Candidatus Pacebacteria bacterium RIFOXYB1_FULL_44_10]HAU98687.1 hypothetical protein [Candidatus Paceibacterota bacterium]HAX01887.1 hypothetical protein [Candidatus Paceibacterota bacterium]